MFEFSSIIFRVKSNFLMLLKGVSMKSVMTIEAAQIANNSFKFIIDDAVKYLTSFVLPIES